MRTLKMKAITSDGNFYGMNQEESDKYFKTLSKDVIMSRNQWYLHGELEDRVGFDKAIITNTEPSDFRNKIIGKDLIIEGIYDVEVDNIDFPCIAYFYLCPDDKQTRGLVCMKDDTEACEYALEKYNEKAYIL